jgi:hypothetical protein
MGLRSRRQAKQLPELVRGLEFLRSSMAALEATDGQAQGTGTSNLELDATIEQAKKYLAEYEADGDVADPGFQEWLSHARAFVAVGLGSTIQARRRTPETER